MKRSVLCALAAALAFLATAPAHAAAPKRVCAALQPGFMHCDAFAKPRTTTRGGIAGYIPADLQSAYALADTASSAGGDKTVAIVDAYDDPNAEADLANYRTAFGLPACTTANGCFQKVNENGGSTLPAADADWATEISLDLDMVSAICPNCHILLIEASSNGGDALFTAQDTAVALGADAISNSWGGGEVPFESDYESYFDHAGTPITVSSGDDGFGVEYPAASSHVTAVGGTSLEPASNARGWTETAWNGAGSGCSLYIPKPAWQADSGCSRRTVADVSAVADPYTGVAVYDTYGGAPGWDVYGGTSAAAPIVAAAYALLGTSASSPSFPYQNPTYFNDVVSGSNGACSSPLYLCTSGAGFDGPTGVGTPNLAHSGDGSAPSAGGGDSGSTAPTGGSAPTPPAPQPVTPPASSIAVSSRVLKASRSGRVTVQVTCGNGAMCAGVLSLQMPLHGGALKTIGKGRYSLTPGQKRSVSIKLSKTAMRTLTKKRRLRVYGTALDADGTAAQASVVIHAPKKHRRRVRHR